MHPWSLTEKSCAAKQETRRVVRLEDFTEQEMALIAQGEAPARDAHLDAELKGWRP